MPYVNEMIESKFLRKEDIEDDLVVTIKTLTLEDMPGDENKQRWVLVFTELPKGLVLNTTMIRVLEKAFGRHTDQWLNQRVTLYVDMSVAFKGQVVGGLRVRPLKAKTTKAAMEALAAKKPPPEDFNDEIPAQ